MDIEGSTKVSLRKKKTGTGHCGADKFKANLGYLEDCRPASATRKRPCLKTSRGGKNSTEAEILNRCSIGEVGVGAFQVQHRQTLVMSSIVNRKQEKGSLRSSSATMLGNGTGGTGRAQVPQKPLLHSR